MYEKVTVTTYKGNIIKISPMSLYVGPTLPLLPPRLESLRAKRLLEYSSKYFLNGNLKTPLVRRISITGHFTQDYESFLFMREPPEPDEIESSSDESRSRHRAHIRARLARSDEDISSSD